jgi:serine protease inhibitor
MPYQGGELAMLVLLPDDPAGLAELEQTLSLPRLKEIVSKLRIEHDVWVWFPKFTFERRYELNETLEKMGMPTVFTPQADLSGIDGTRGLIAGSVVHKAFVQVDETGTEAAAVTDASMLAGGATPPHLTFAADHPFVFVIRDIKAGTILFMGRVAKP